MSADWAGLFNPAVYVSLAFYFGIAAQFRAMGGYTFLRRVLASTEGRLGIVYAVSAVTFLFSPFILNDVLVLILTPAVIEYAREHRLDPAPLVVAEVTFTNISSSLTPIGNPQNILLWTTSGVSFVGFVRGTSPYVLAAAIIAAAAQLPLARGVVRTRELPSAVGSLAPAWYLVFVTVVVLVSDFVGIPGYLSLAAGFLGGFAFNGRSLAAVVPEFEGKGLLILYLFVGATAIAAYLLGPWIAGYVYPAAQGQQPYSGAFLAVLSNVVSNVPATQLLIKTAGVLPSVAPKIAAEAGLAGNFGPVASLANLLALQIAARSGVSLRRVVVLQLAVGAISFIPALF